MTYAAILYAGIGTMKDNSEIDMGILFDAALSAQLVFTPDLGVVAANRRYCEMLGIARDDLVGRRVFEAFPANPDDPEANAEQELQASTDRVVASGEPQEMPVRQHDVMDADGHYRVRYWRIVNSPVFADTEDPGKVTHVIHTAEDITSSILGDRVHEAKRRAAMRGADLAYFEWCPDKETFSRTPQFDVMFGFSRGELGNATQPFIDRVHPDDLPDLRATLDRAARTIGANLHNDYRVVWPDGTTRWMISRGESIQDPETQQILVVGTLVDVTHIKENEARLRDALAARDLLIAEVNHRVKNSLQMVTSILNLEANGVEDENARRSLEAATARVRAVAAIHALLYEDENVQSVQIRRYLDRLIDHLRASLSGIGQGTRVELDVDPIRVPTDTAVTLSLAVNELVTNSFKHGSWNDGEGAVMVRLHRNGTGMIVLEVSDNGTGRADKQLDLTSSGLGKRLVSGMAAQLGGTVEEEQNNGWRTRIHFPG